MTEREPWLGHRDLCPIQWGEDCDCDNGPEYWRSKRWPMAEPATKGYEISRFEVRQFMRALGLDPAEVESIRIVKARAVATLTTGTTVHIRITETRK